MKYQFNMLSLFYTRFLHTIDKSQARVLYIRIYEISICTLPQMLLFSLIVLLSV